MIQLFTTQQKKNQFSSFNILVQKINQQESKLHLLNDNELKQKTKKLQKDINQNGENDELLVEAFAIVRETSLRVLGLRHYNVQLIGGMILNSGNIAEMQTGEGKTLVCTLPAYLNALTNKGVHIVTVNEYLAKRDALSVGKIFKFLGLSVGIIQQNMSKEDRRKSYLCDITYTTNSELGFDFLKDNLATSMDTIVQRNFNYCIIDEVDSILIDEARTPLIISGEISRSKSKYLKAAYISRELEINVDYEVDYKAKNILLTERGLLTCEFLLNKKDLYKVKNPWGTFILNALKAKELFINNSQYIIQNDEITIIDEFTGRVMPGRKWSDGLHQALEAKEGLTIKNETKTLASITYQNFFLLYPKLSGMTGTAKTEEVEFERIYNLKVLCVPTNKKSRRIDQNDLVFRTAYAKWKATANDCKRLNSLGIPVLVGTTSVKNSEIISHLLSHSEIKHELLNAKPDNIKRESIIISQAGQQNALTIATNIAGRGTDIILGGNLKTVISSTLQNQKLNNRSKNLLDFLKKITEPETEGIKLDRLDNTLFTLIEDKIINYYKNDTKQEQAIVCQKGGLHIIGTEKNEARRIDNQLRGRSGRQGDPGNSIFFLSLEDDLLKIFGGDQISQIMETLNIDQDMPLESNFVTKSLVSAQKKVENYYFDSRKQLFEYDEIMNQQRQVIFLERSKILTGKNLRHWIIKYIEVTVLQLIKYYTRSTTSKRVDQELSSIRKIFALPYNLKLRDIVALDNKEVQLIWQEQARITFDLKESQIEYFEPGLMRQFEKLCLLQQVDLSWQQHLQEMSTLKEIIGWRSYGQKDPLIEYKNEGFQNFLLMTNALKQGLVYLIFRSKVVSKIK
jgi:preprotein translocase subunit SecA